MLQPLSQTAEVGRESDMGRVMNGLEREVHSLRDNIQNLTQRLMPMLNQAKPATPTNVKDVPRGLMSPIVESLENTKQEVNCVNTEVLELLERLSI